MSYVGEAAARLRAALGEHSEKHRLNVLQTWLGDDYHGAIGSDFSYGPVDDLTVGLEFRCRARIDRAARRIQNLMVFRVPWSNPLSMTGPMSAAERNKPLVVPFSFHVVEEHAIDLPAGVTPQAIPDPAAYQCPWGKYERRIQVDGNRLVCNRRVRLAGDTFVPAERFTEIQEFWRHCSWAEGAEVVLQCNEG